MRSRRSRQLDVGQAERLRAVLDANVLVSALLSPRGAPARLLSAWLEGVFEIVASPALLAELQRVLQYPKLRERITSNDADAFLALLARAAIIAPDTDDPPPIRAADVDDDYLISLAASQNAVLVTGDKQLLAMADDLPIRSPASFLETLDELMLPPS